jgi:signal transduction histidine kinase
VLKSGYTSPAVYVEMWQTLTEGRVWRGELHNKKKNGELYTELAVIAPIFGADGRTKHYVAIKDDITERKRADAAAREVLERFNVELEQKVAYRTEELASRNRQIEALLHAIPDTVMRLRSDGSLIFSKAALSSRALAASTPREDEPIRDAASAELLAACLELGRRTFAEKSTATGEAQITGADGTVVLELRAAPTGTDEFVVFVRDITARKRLEAETAALLEKEHQVSDMKTRFISVTSHEFRTPMAAAMGSVELLANHLDQLAPAKRAELFARINTSLHRMTEMLDDILTLNRMDADRMEVRLQSIDIALFLRNVVEEIRLGDRDAHRFELHTPEGLPPFPTDVHLLHHILANLLSNAVRYSPAGKLVTVTMEVGATGLRLIVADQGIGIPPADRARIFEPFERGSNVGHIKGTGLGLNIVKRMTQLLGGTVRLDSVEGGGSRFTVELSRPAPNEISP